MAYHYKLALVEDRPGLIVMISLFFVIQFLFISARFYARKLKHAPLAADDWIALASFVRCSTTDPHMAILTKSDICFRP